MGDITPTGIRERLWIDKFDHSTDPPRVVERLFIENGVVMKREYPDKQMRTVESKDAGTVAATERGSEPVVEPKQQEKEPSDVDPQAEAESERRRRESGGR